MPKFINLFSLILEISGDTLTSLSNFGNVKNLVFSWLRNIFFCYITWFNRLQKIRLFSHRNFDNGLRFFITVSNFIRTTWWCWLFLISADPIIRNIRCCKSSRSHGRAGLSDRLRWHFIALWNLKSSSRYLNLRRFLNVLVQNFVFFLDLL